MNFKIIPEKNKNNEYTFKYTVEVYHLNKFNNKPEKLHSSTNLTRQDVPKYLSGRIAGNINEISDFAFAVLEDAKQGYVIIGTDGELMRMPIEGLY